MNMPNPFYINDGREAKNSHYSQKSKYKDSQKFSKID